MSRKNLSFWKKGRKTSVVPNDTNTPFNIPESNLSESSNSGRKGSANTVPTFDLPSTKSPPSFTLSQSQSFQSNENGGAEGLSLLYTPDNGHKADIVFVHGLGGTSQLTWSKYKNLQLFWPLTFLPLEPDICLARILTFGYDADFRKAGNLSTSILDFAKTLLFDLKYAQDSQKRELGMGRVPLIFVVHSMGGLIVKEAYIQGQNDPEYESIIKAISAITFLATPHRGTNLAETLNRILQSTFFSNSKQYISELSRNSFALQKLNEQFRHIAPRLDIVSFYETQPTSIGLKKAKIMVLEKDSSVLGYPGEMSKSMNADHHGICKYESPGDPNYVNVRNILKSLVSKIISTSNFEALSPADRRDSVSLKSFLGVTELPDTDYIFFRDQWTQGTSDWILEEPAYLEWLHDQRSAPHLIWLSGGAGTGKSVLSSFIINSLVEEKVCCAYFFIRFGDKHKRTLSHLLRTIAYQIAQAKPEFSRRVLELADEAIDFGTTDSNSLWERLFKMILFTIDDNRPIYWVIDGLDEADSPRAILRQLADAGTSLSPIRILVVSRRTTEIEVAIQKFPRNSNISRIRVEGHQDDMRGYIKQELSMTGNAVYEQEITQRLIAVAQDNFLWVRLAVEKLNQCHTNDEVELAFQELPVGMEKLYNRMATKILNLPSPRDRRLAMSILQPVTCSARILTVAELSYACNEDTSTMLDFQRSIIDLCGGFLVVDNDGHVAMLHQTAREYLIDDTICLFSVPPSAAHEKMFLSCMQCLMTIGLRANISRNQTPVFLDYAAVWWSHHLLMSTPGSSAVMETLNKFLSGKWVLTWIEILARIRKSRVLVQTSKNFLKYVDKNEEQILSSEAIEASNIFVGNVKSWAVDLGKIVAKFGTLLQSDPTSIYRNIPPFCPPGSSIYQQFGKSEAKSLDISGLSARDWDDSLARLSTGLNTYTSAISTAGAQIAILTSSGDVSVFDSSTFDDGPASPIRHGEFVYRMVLNTSGTLLCTYGYETTRVWDISTGNCRLKIPNVNSRPRPLAMLFVKNNTSLLVGTDDRRVRSLDLTVRCPTWNIVAELDEPELEGLFLNSASYMALNFDGSLIAVAYRGHPTAAWELDGQLHINHCWLQGGENELAGEVIDACWHPHHPELLGLYLEGVVFKWNPYENHATEFPVTGVSKLQISRDGNLFATGDVHGTVKVYTTSDFRLIYCLASEDPVLGLAFSPDSRRFFDIRGYYGNAWEPNALLRFTEQMDKGDDGDSETSSLTRVTTSSASTYAWVDNVTAVASSPRGRFCSYGTDKGVVKLYDNHLQDRKTLFTSKSHLSIEQMAWSRDGRHLSFSDASKTIFLFSINVGDVNFEPRAEIQAQIPMRQNTEGHVLQLLFSPKNKYLMVFTLSTICCISLASQEVLKSTTASTAGFKWLLHPQNSELIVGLGPETIILYDWDLQLRRVFNTERPKSPAGHRSVDRVISTLDNKYILVQIATSGHGVREKTFTCFPVSSLSLLEHDDSGIVKIQEHEEVEPIPLLERLPSHVAQVLHFLSGYRLVFLSREFSICSWRLPLGGRKSSGSLFDVLSKEKSFVGTDFTTRSDSPGSWHTSKCYTTLFSLPGDWISRECLALCSIWPKENSFMCPRSGEVAVVRCSSLV